MPDRPAGDAESRRRFIHYRKRAPHFAAWHFGDAMPTWLVRDLGLTRKLGAVLAYIARRRRRALRLRLVRSAMT